MQSPLRHVLVRQAAGFIAQGMARASGRPAVCFATSGPGATNLVTALADARMDSIPIALRAPVVLPDLGLVRPQWQGNPESVLTAVVASTGVTLDELCSRNRTQRIADARRLALLVWTKHFGRPAVELARALRISESSASELLSTAPASLQQTATGLASVVRLAEAELTVARVG